MKQKNMGRGAGFSLVEILVGMVIGLLGIIIITQIFALAEGQKRTTTSGADAQTNGNIALYTIERDARQAGYGMNLAGLGCTINTTIAGNLVLAPVIITDGGPNAAGDPPDQLQLFYSTSTMGMPVSSSASTATSATIASTLTVADHQNDANGNPIPNTGDMVIFYEAGKNCALAKVTNVVDIANFTQDSATWSTAWPGYSASATVYDFGSMVNRNYSIDAANNNLQAFDISSSGLSTVPISGEIVNLQAQYGKDTNGDGVVDTWNTCTPGAVGCPAATPANWAQILAVRIAILARSGQYEKPNAAGVCTATIVAPTWSGGTMAVQPAGGGLPSCYRYKVFETVVPLRNIIWG